MVSVVKKMKWNVIEDKPGLYLWVEGNEWVFWKEHKLGEPYLYTGDTLHSSGHPLFIDLLKKGWTLDKKGAHRYV